MKRKPIINRRFKYLMAVFIILFGQLLPLYPQQAEAAADNWLNFKFDEFSQNTVKSIYLEWSCHDRSRAKYYTIDTTDYVTEWRRI